MAIKAVVLRTKVQAEFPPPGCQCATCMEKASTPAEKALDLDPDAQADDANNVEAGLTLAQQFLRDVATAAASAKTKS